MNNLETFFRVEIPFLDSKIPPGPCLQERVALSAKRYANGKCLMDLREDPPSIELCRVPLSRGVNISLNILTKTLLG